MSLLSSDLQVDQLSTCLNNQEIDVVVAGSIGAIESPRLVRCLRRLGAQVRVYLTEGGARFITPTSLEWASAQPVVTDWSGAATHLANCSNLIVTPASADFIAKAAHGICDTPALALFASHLGNGSQILVLPNMHDSMAQSPIHRHNLATLGASVSLLSPRLEEGKQKFPDPETLADEVAHCINKAQVQKRVLVTAGGTYTEIDAARHLGNKSTGRLGAVIATDLYRHGFAVDVILGTHQVAPKIVSSISDAPRYEEMAECLDRMTSATRYDAIICAAAVSDYAPKKTQSGKISSAEHESLTLELMRTPKLLEQIKGRSPRTIAFKLLSGAARGHQQETAARYLADYHLDSIIVNFIDDVSATHHRATAFSADNTLDPTALDSRAAIARFITERALSPLQRGHE